MTFELRDIQFSYASKHRGRRKVLDGVTLSVQLGECVGIIGHEGAGKTSLLQVMIGLLNPGAGSVHINRVDVREKGKVVSDLRQRIGFAFQFPEQQFFCETVKDELLYASRNFAMRVEHLNPEDALRAMGLQPELYLQRSPFSLSMGEARRVALAILLMANPQALLLDEPTVGLDGAGVDIVLSLLRKARNAGTTMVIVSHEIDVLAEVASRIIILESGTVAVDGSVEAILTNEELLLRYGYQLPEVERFVRNHTKRLTGDDVGFFRLADARSLLQSINGAQ